jgi:hypothetical protein
MFYIQKTGKINFIFLRKCCWCSYTMIGNKLSNSFSNWYRWTSSYLWMAWWRTDFINPRMLTDPSKTLNRWWSVELLDIKRGTHQKSKSIVWLINNDKITIATPTVLNFRRRKSITIWKLEKHGESSHTLI